MSRSISWIDRRQFDALLGRALLDRQPAPAAPRAWDVAEAARVPKPPLSPSLSEHPPAPRGQMTHNGATAPSIPSSTHGASSVPPAEGKRRTLVPYRPPAGSLDVRAKALLDWLMRKLGSTACFVSDEHGLALVERNATMEHLAACAALVGTLENVRRMMFVEAGSLSMLLAENQLLCCVVEDTDLGRLAVGLIQEDKLSEAQMGIVAAALRATFSKEEEEA